MTNTSQIRKTLRKLPKARLRHSVRIKFYFQILLKELRFRPRFIVYPATLLVLVFLGVSVYAYYAVSVTDGDMLFGLKTKIEHIKLAKADSGYEKSLAYLSIADRRLKEAEYLAKSSSRFSFVHTAYAAPENTETPLSRTVWAMSVYTKKAINEAITVIEARKSEELLATISERQEEQLAVLTEIKATGVEKNNSEVIDSVILITEHRQEEIITTRKRVGEEQKKGIKNVQFQLKKLQKRMDDIVPDSEAVRPTQQDVLPAPNIKNNTPPAPTPDNIQEPQSDDHSIPVSPSPQKSNDINNKSDTRNDINNESDTRSDINNESDTRSEENTPEDINSPLPENGQNIPKTTNKPVP